MAWKPLGLFKSEGSSLNSADNRQSNSSITSTENTARSLFVNTSIEKAFNEKPIVSIKMATDTEKK